MRKILLVEDDPVVHKLVQASLKNDFEIVSRFSIRESLSVLEAAHEIEMIIIDRSLPDGDGIELCAKIREIEALQALPVIFLSSRSSESDKVSGLFAGANDYITKPFSQLELRARVLAHLRKNEQRIFVGSIEIDLETHRVHSLNERTKNEIVLTPIEFKLLTAMAQALGKVLRRDFLLTRVWGEDQFVNDRLIDTHVSHLRKKLTSTDIVLEAIRGEGYRLHVEKKTASHAA